MFTTANPIDVNKLTQMAMANWYHRKSRDMNNRNHMNTQMLLGATSLPSPGPTTRSFSRTPMNVDTLIIRNPMNIRIKAFTEQRYTLVNRTNFKVPVRRIRSIAKRHISTLLPSSAANRPTIAEQVATPVIWAVADEVDFQTDRQTSSTPAGSGRVANWSPTLTPYLPTSGLELFRNAVFTQIAPLIAPSDNFLYTLRRYHAKDQMQPWHHSFRWQVAQQRGEASVASESMGGKNTVGGWQSTLSIATPSAAISATSGSATTSDPPISTYWGVSYRGDELDTTILNMPILGDAAWKPADIASEYSGAENVGPGNTVVPPTLAGDSLQVNPSYKEQKKGTIDRFFKRRSYVKWLKPGGRMKFKERTYINVRPLAMGIFGATGTSGSATINAPAAARWRERNFVTSGTTDLQPVHGSTGLGFATATSGLCGPRLINGSGNDDTSAPYEYPRLMYSKRTDPLGSPCTTKLNTIVLRGTLTPLDAAIAPFVGPTWTASSQTRIMVHRSTYWRTKMYEKRDRIGRFAPFTPVVLQNTVNEVNTSAQAKTSHVFNNDGITAWNGV